MSWLEANRHRRYAVDLDVAGCDDQLDDRLRGARQALLEDVLVIDPDALAHGLDLAVEVVTLEGPSGWPLVRFTGVPDQLVQLLGRYHEGDEQAVYEALDAAEPVDEEGS